jgi:hypothetical protein
MVEMVIGSGAYTEYGAEDDKLDLLLRSASQ